MMQQLLTTSRQLTLGAYKHETECKKTNSMRAHCTVIVVFYNIVFLYVPSVHLQLGSWNRGQRRNWNLRKRKPVRRLQSWKTNLKSAERTSTIWKPRSESLRKTVTTRSIESGRIYHFVVGHHFFKYIYEILNSRFNVSNSLMSFIWLVAERCVFLLFIVCFVSY